jgi:hypothetical protein
VCQAKENSIVLQFDKVGVGSILAFFTLLSNDSYADPEIYVLLNNGLLQDWYSRPEKLLQFVTITEMLSVIRWSTW